MACFVVIWSSSEVKKGHIITFKRMQYSAMNLSHKTGSSMQKYPGCSTLCIMGVFVTLHVVFVDMVMHCLSMNLLEPDNQMLRSILQANS